MVLALLSAKPAHGYELKTSFDQAVGDQWGGLNIGHIYQILDRLARDGLIDSQRQPQQVKPDRVVHRLTPAWRAELDRWLAEPAIPARGYRDDFFLKVMAAVRLRRPGGAARRARPGARAPAAATARPGPRPHHHHHHGRRVTADHRAELHIRADLGVVDAAEKTLSTGPASTGPSAAVTGPSASGQTPPQTAAG